MHKMGNTHVLKYIRENNGPKDHVLCRNQDSMGTLIHLILFIYII